MPCHHYFPGIVFLSSRLQHSQKVHTSQRTRVAADLFAVVRVRKVDEVIIVHLLCVDDVTVLFLTQVLRVDTIGSEEFLVGHTESLTNGLCYELGLDGCEKIKNCETTGKINEVINTSIILM